MKKIWTPTTPADEFNFPAVVAKCLIAHGQADDALASIHQGSVIIEIRPGAKTASKQIDRLLAGLDISVGQAVRFDASVSLNDLPTLAASIGYDQTAYLVAESLYCRLADRVLRIDLGGDLDGWNLPLRRSLRQTLKRDQYKLDVLVEVHPRLRNLPPPPRPR